METIRLLADVEVKDRGEKGHAQALHADHHGRALRWALLPGQSVQPHNAPHSPVYLIVLQGAGYFSGEDGAEQKLGPNDMAIFARGETHTARAESEELVFIAILHEAPNPGHGH
jgi:quercetin dioxygenase-like cupin family protein